MNRTTSSPIDIKSATIQGLSLILRSGDMGAIESDLSARVSNAGDLFTNAPVLIDVTALTADGTAEKLELNRLINLLRRHKMRAVGIVGAAGLLLDQAGALGLIEELDIRPRSRPKAPEPEVEPAPEQIAAAEPSEASDLLPLADLFSDASPAPAPVAADVREDVQAAVREAVAGLTSPTLVIDRPLRSGQRVYARGGDLVLLGVVSHGAEVIADGNIHVYGPLRGRAIAGASGDAEARIFAGSMEPELISIAGTYRTTDRPLAADVQGKPALARLDGEKMLFEPLKN